MKKAHETKKERTAEKPCDVTEKIPEKRRVDMGVKAIETTRSVKERLIKSGG